MNRIAFIIFALFFSTPSFSAELKQETLERLYVASNVSQMVDAIHGQVGAMFAGVEQSMNIQPNEKPIFDKYFNQLEGLLREEVTFEKMRGDLDQIYMKHFTEEEVQGMVDFYESDVGKSMVSKMPMVVQESMVMSQTMMQSMMPKIEELVKELKADLKAERAKQSSNEGG